MKDCMGYALGASCACKSADDCLLVARQDPTPAVCPQCHNTDPDACSRCIIEAES